MVSVLLQRKQAIYVILPIDAFGVREEEVQVRDIVCFAAERRYACGEGGVGCVDVVDYEWSAFGGALVAEAV